MGDLGDGAPPGADGAAVDDEIIVMLTRLAESGDPRAALAALPFVWAPERGLLTGWMPTPWRDTMMASRAAVPTRIAVAAHEAIRRLIVPMPAQALPALDEALRRLTCAGWAISIGQSFVRIAPPQPRDVTGPARVQLLGLLASHADGRVREAAVAELAATADTEGLPFLVWRCADWVPQVRERALRATRARLQAGPVAPFAPLLPLLGRLDRIARIDLSALTADIRACLLHEPGQAALVRALRSPNHRLRREVCRVLDALMPAPAAEVVDCVCRDEDLLVRVWLPQWEQRLRSVDPVRAAELRGRLAADPSSRMRQHALAATVDAGDPDVARTLQAGLLDSSAGVRQLARFHLHRRNADADFAAGYRAALASGGRHLAAAIAGLGETGVAADRALILPFVEGTPRQARAALKAAVRLGAEECRDVLLRTLADRRDGVCREALALLEPRLRDGDGAILESLWPAGTAAARRTLAAAMLRLSPWTALLGLLRLSVTDPERPAGTAAAVLTRWRPEHLANYAPLPPPAPLRGPIDAALASAMPALPPHVTMPLQETLRRWPAPAS